MTRVLVLGGTGTLGRPAVRSLTRSGHRVRVLARDQGKADGLFGSDVEVMAGDCTEEASMAMALEGCQAVHISLPQASELRAVQTLLRVAPPESLTRISYVSGTSVRPENRRFALVQEKLRCEALITASGIPYTIFCPTWVMEALPRFVRGNRVTVISGPNPALISFLAGADFGRMVATAYGTPESLGKRLVLHGPEAMTLPAVLELYRKECCPEAKPMVLSPWKARLLARVNRKMRPVVELITYFDEVGEVGDPAEADALLGGPEITLQSWVEGKRKAC